MADPLPQAKASSPTAASLPASSPSEPPCVMQLAASTASISPGNLIDMAQGAHSPNQQQKSFSRLDLAKLLASVSWQGSLVPQLSIQAQENPSSSDGAGQQQQLQEHLRQHSVLLLPTSPSSSTVATNVGGGGSGGLTSSQHGRGDSQVLQLAIPKMLEQGVVNDEVLSKDGMQVPSSNAPAISSGSPSSTQPGCDDAAVAACGNLNNGELGMDDEEMGDDVTMGSGQSRPKRYRNQKQKLSNSMAQKRYRERKKRAFMEMRVVIENLTAEVDELRNVKIENERLRQTVGALQELIKRQQEQMEKLHGRLRAEERPEALDCQQEKNAATEGSRTPGEPTATDTATAVGVAQGWDQRSGVRAIAKDGRHSNGGGLIAEVMPIQAIDDGRGGLAKAEGGGSGSGASDCSAGTAATSTAAITVDEGIPIQASPSISQPVLVSQPSTTDNLVSTLQNEWNTHIMAMEQVLMANRMHGRPIGPISEEALQLLSRMVSNLYSLNARLVSARVQQILEANGQNTMRICRIFHGLAGCNNENV